MRKKIGLGQKKELNADLNLTPFIDLLSTCVCFLLITAVWIEIGTVEIKQSHGTEAKASKEVTYDLDLVYTNPTKINLNLKRSGRRVRTFKVSANSEADFQKNLNVIIRDKVMKFRNKVVKIATATVMPRTNVNYGQLVQTLDTLRRNEIVNIGVMSGK